MCAGHSAVSPFPLGVRQRLHPYTLELTQCAHFTHVKQVATKKHVSLDEFDEAIAKL
eukprot:COSAG02_NODE_6149_length_3767_cov_1.609051_3_plen_57_part_00